MVDAQPAQSSTDVHDNGCEGSGDCGSQYVKLRNNRGCVDAGPGVASQPNVSVIGCVASRRQVEDGSAR